ncbi:GNAT family N-acetyltransferase [Micromonospora sp. WMMD812]|uniref:GNAT family N-acetyltransferase n=1 Tax=Micromonospora sp. WMMD812 TaxID=3015152 RepID=UPI00248B4428|nr:GNAT family N-acetyltransferase [Micromonospora sp. WMMD812]WBB68738.1 GNAT family N-acetyltransferase [Micromonospora sp. WMMD812]
MRSDLRSAWAVAPARPDQSDAAGLLREYFEEIVVRYHHRPARSGEVAAAMADSPSDDLVTPTGILLLATHDGAPAGCAGLRFRPAWAELTRVYVRPALRGRGGGAVLLAAAEEQARMAGADRVRLDTRSDLVEARALYARHGYVEIPAYSRDAYAEHWFEKLLG